MQVFRSIFHGQVSSKKNSKTIGINRRTGKPFVRMNDRAKEQEFELIRKFNDDFIDQGFFEPLNGAVEVIVEIWDKDLRAYDLDNQISTVLDALVKAQVLEDDNQKYVSQIKGYYRGVDKEDPRMVLTIYQLSIEK